MFRLAEFTARTILRALSWLPDCLLSLIARIIYILIYPIAGYRLPIVRENIRRSFPELKENDYSTIEKKYYRHLSELLPEMISYIRLKKMRKNSKAMELNNPGLLASFLAEKQNLIMMMGHFGNWEWCTIPLIAAGYRIIGIYKPQSGRLADSIMKWVRLKPGIEAVPMKDTIRVIRREQESGAGPFILILVSDQTPARGDIHYWSHFLNQDTAFFTGGGKIAKKFRIPVVYADQEKTGFGRYRMNLAPLAEPEQEMDEFQITEAFISQLEKSIRRNPHLWLWSHRRWKYQKENVPLKA